MRVRLGTRLRASLAAVAVLGATAAMAASGSGAAFADTTAPGGTWGSMPELPGLVALTYQGGGNDYSQSSFSGLSCSSPGNCAAVGTYGTSSAPFVALFVAVEVNGAWGVQPVTGLPADPQSTTRGTTPSFKDVSCGAAGSCTAVGTFTGTDGIQRVFTVTETGGTWGAPAVLDTTGLGSVQTLSIAGLSCPAAGECTIAGGYGLASGASGLFTANESGGNWGTPQPFSLASLPSDASSVAGVTTAPGVSGYLTSLSCGAPGDCTAAGVYWYGTSVTYGEVPQPFIMTEAGHTWGAPRVIPGLALLSPDGSDTGRGYQNEITSISCPDAGDCAAVGHFYPQPDSPAQLFTLDEAGGTWGQAQALGTPGSGSAPVSCRSAGDCVIAVNVSDASGQSEPATVSESSSGAWGTATGIPGIAAGGGSVDSVTCVPSGDCTVLGTYYTTSGGYSGEVFSATEPDGGPMGAAQQVGALGYDSNQPDLHVSCPQNGHCTAVYDWSGYGLPGEPQVATEGAPAVPAAESTVTVTPSAPVLYGIAGESESLTVTVSSAAGGAPVGEVGVNAPGVVGTICSVTLSGGTATCQVTPGDFWMGANTLTASYLGDPDHLPATGTGTVTMAQAATVTHLAFTPGSATFSGAGTTLTVSGTVSSAHGAPSGSAIVQVDGKAVSGCINVGVFAGASSGAFSCKGTTGVLTAGKHLVTLSYLGTGTYGSWTASTSAPLPLTVSKRGTATSLALAKASVTYGHESYEKFTVSVSRAGSVYPTGKVAVRIGTTTICTITLSKGTGGCVLANTRLRAGTYTLAALYSGDGNYAPSWSAKKTLKVAK
jgi:hypothetical protein